MAPGIHPFVDSFDLATRSIAKHTAVDDPETLIALKILMAALPVIGLIVGVVVLALWTAH